MKITLDRTIGSIVAEDYRAAAVLTSKGIDFCCKGGRSVAEVCEKKGLDPALLEKEIQELLSRDTKEGSDFKTWALADLADHIEKVHHGYIELRVPVIQQYLNKLCKVHGDRHPELFDIAREFNECAGAMAQHMKKEELMLFPFIKQLEKAQRKGTVAPAPHFGTVNNPVHMMMEDHDAEGERFRRIEELSGGYMNPPDGCATYSTAMMMLKDFQSDLHLHIHLENNILFPRAVELETVLTTA
ncbi:MAG: iron-sulfur cluster repair di-iron protein [Flavobacteriales bacterium]|nr:iron-sulfur cluster repair di-iron protein [Flavobacteriales bacterium]MBK7240952.1 iron-sulfur cluster repair di-iron protein [Flavobacteriales bacterium]MBK9536301.1 iron-sulfur cluster repair di-iron protein [Flavobacteriales bacterium]HQV53371.1 iron-sulfur cluster repair di-iron protein [Flavobacteriales bacterium]HQX31518.1 iron-sulfur cluster repair di-iron protein [Flavobacteriales bacterium]